MDDRLLVDPQTVRRLLEDQFPHLARLPVVPVTPGGWNNRTFRLGDRMSVRLPSAARYAAEVAKEQAVLPWLAPRVPVLIPKPVALGRPGAGYPFQWSIMEWIDGETAAVAALGEAVPLARDLGAFLRALHRVETTGGPEAGEHSFHRGGDLRVYDGEVRTCLEGLVGAVDAGAARAVWGAALASRWQASPVWVHGDLAPGNLLLRGGRLRAVIDFGNVAVGDPACDLVIAWTLLDDAARAAFRASLDLDAAAWARARGWALWKAMLIMAGRSRPVASERAPEAVLDAVVAEHYHGCG
jgi:aminoglycoside phosphotransferase (APT) family kinase protein